MAILKFATPIWRASPCRLALASAGMGSLSGISGFGQCTSRRSTKSTPRVFRLCSTERAKSSARRYSCDTLVVRKISLRGRPGADAFAGAALGAVFPSGVDMTVAEPERACDDLAAIAQGGGAKADGGHLGAVRGQCGDRGGSH